MTLTKNLSLLLVVALLFISSACSSSVEEASATVDMSDVIIDKDFMGKSNVELSQSETRKSVPTFGDIPQSSEKTLPDGSTLVTTYDNYGNKMETRTFANHPAVVSLTVITGSDGVRKIEARGQSGEKRELPQDWLDRAFELSPDEIARTAQISAKRMPSLETTTVSTSADYSAPRPVSPVAQSAPQIYAPTTKEIKQQPSAPTQAEPLVETKSSEPENGAKSVQENPNKPPAEN